LLQSLLQSLLLDFLFEKEFCCFPLMILKEAFFCVVVVTKFSLLSILFSRIFVAYHLMILKASIDDGNVFVFVVVVCGQ